MNEHEPLQTHEVLEKRVEQLTAELAETSAALQFSRLCIDKAGIGIFHSDENGIIFSVNEYACSRLGYSKEELCSLRVFDIDPAINPEKMTEIGKILTDTGSVTHETIHRRKDGSTFPVEITANLLEFQGKRLGISFVKDITERKRSEEALRAAEAEKALILNSTMDYVTYLDPAMKIVWTNRKTAAMKNLPLEEITGRHCWEVIHKRDKPCEECPVMVARDTGEPHKVEKHHTNGLILKMRAYPIKSADGRLLGVAEFVSDITERKLAEEALKKAHDELESRVRERTEQLSSLAAELSLVEERERRRIATELHDQVGQNLIMSKIRLGSLSPELPAEQFAAVLGEIREQITRSIEGIRTLTFQLSPPLLYEVGFEAAVEWLAEEFEGQHGLQVVFQDDGKRKPLDQEEGIALYQMIRELLVNIVKHAKAKKVRIVVEKMADAVRIIVADDGSGFDGLQDPKLGKRNAGFGLFNIRQRIEYLGGELAIESKINGGSRVTLLFPLRETK